MSVKRNIMPSVLLLMAVSTLSHAATDQVIGGATAEGELRITYKTNGSMNVERYSSGSYQTQVFAGSAKGSLLYNGSTTYAFGYYSGPGVRTLTSLTKTVSGNRSKIVAIWTAGSLSYVHTLTYFTGDSFYRSQWSITNNGGSTLNDLRLFHGQDTYLGGIDEGAGFWIAGNNTVGVQRDSGGVLVRQFLQGSTTPFAYESRMYNLVRASVLSLTLTNAIDGSPSTDNGMALEWKRASLAPGATWTVAASEKCTSAPSGSLVVTAPVVRDAIPNSTIQVPFVVTNVSGSTIGTVNLGTSTTGSGWTTSISSPGSTISNLAAGASQTVTVDIVVPSNAVPGERMNVVLTADDNAAFSMSDTAAAIVPNTPPTVPTDSNATANSVPENASNGTAVNVTASSSDVDSSQTLTYSLLNNSGGRFTIDGSTGIVTVLDGTLLNYESVTGHVITVQVSDGIDETFANFSIAVSNVNETPTNIALSGSTIVENSAIGTTVGTLSTTDPDAADTFTYTLVAGTGDTGNAAFAFAGNALQVAGPIDFEATPSLSIRVRSTDAGSLFYEKVFTVTVTDVVENLAPTDLALSNSSVAENSAIGTTVGTLSSVDADVGDTHTYALVSGSGDSNNAAFTLTGNTLKTAAVFNFEAKTSYSIRVKTTDSGVGALSYEKVLTITVSNVNEQPVIGSAGFTPADALTGETVTFVVSATDPDGTTPAVTIDYGDGSSGVSLTHVYATVGTFAVTVTATDGTLTDTKQMRVAIGSSDFNNDSFVGPMDKDTDRDGVPDAMELAMGTSPTDATDSPVSGSKPISFRMEKPKALFGDSVGDVIEFRGVLHVRAGLNPAGETLVIDAGGNVRKVALDKRSRFSGDDIDFQLLAKLNEVKAKEARFKLKVSGALLANMIQNAPKDEQGRPTQLSAHILFDGKLLIQTKQLTYRK